MGEKSLEERREWSSITGHISRWRGCEDRPDRPTSQGSSEQQHLILVFLCASYYCCISPYSPALSGFGDFEYVKLR